MEAPKDVGGFAAAAPPVVEGLGNYKGVMLCNRPVEDSHPARLRGSAENGPPPFKCAVSAGGSDQLGLQPAKKMEPRSAVKTRGPSAALRRHVQWIKDLQVQVAEEHQRIADDDKAQEQRRQRMQVLFKEQRDNIKELKRQGFNNTDDVRKLESHLQLKAPSTAKSKSKKPLWAMTEEEQEDLEDEEAADLINFAENLDFEKYMGDAEFRHQIQVMKDRAKKLQREQDKFKDDLIRDFNAQADDGDEFGSAYTGSPRGSQADGGSQLGDLPGRTGPAGRARGGVDDRPDWDSSTAFGEDGPLVDRETRSDAGRVMDAMPHLKGIHSKESVQRIIEKAREGTPVV